MTDDAPPGGARGVRTLAEYERRLRGSMKLVSGSTRDAVVREIVAGVEAQVKTAGGEFAPVAPLLDDPRWVARQMVKVYGVAPWAKALCVLGSALLALASVPGNMSQPADQGPAIALALLAFALLVALLFWTATRVSATAGALAGGAAAALRVVAFVLPQGEFSPLQTATAGEVSLFLLATGLLLVIAVVPMVVARARGGAEEA